MSIYTHDIVNGVEVPLTPDQIAALEARDAAALIPNRKAKMVAQVESLRDAKIDGGVTFLGVVYQTDADSRENIVGIGQAALAALVGGAQTGNLRWMDASVDFTFIAADNSRTPMDAPTALAFYETAARYKKALIFRASDLKTAINAAADIAALDAIDIGVDWPT